MIWIIGIITYLLFRLWYDNWRGPLKPHEIDVIRTKMDEMAKSATMEATGREAMEKFMAEDDGKEFYMLNIVKLHEGSVAHPETGEQMSAFRLLNQYTQPFLRSMLRRAGHPLMMARPMMTDGYIDAWNAGENPGWNLVGMVRYRSRRDMMAAVINDKFDNIHAFKIAAMDKTWNIPMGPRPVTLLGPRYSVALIIAFICALIS